jgi:DNA-binding response OmpR family regulator
VYVRYLRRKLDDPDHELIETVRGVGYRLRG